jgi:4-hydroxythreonine-4-phosphate dehydrogenase
MTPLPRIAITAGEPAGIGPDLCVMLQRKQFKADITIIADNPLLASRAQQIGVPTSAIKVRHVALKSSCIAGRLDPANSSYVLETLTLAAQGCMTGEYDAMITAPVHKGVINDAGIPFTGHTEFLAELTQTPKVVMMLVGGGMRVALATIHLALGEVPGMITQDSLESTIKILHADLVQKFGISQPHIFVAGLNPHAGEDGYLGSEEIAVINPVLEKLRLQGMQLTGALPADTMFSKNNLRQADCFLAMYHDQGLPVLKYASFGQGVNVTLGLPIIRTSVDHGTALDLAGSSKANPGSLVTAIELAIELANKQLAHKHLI